MAMSNKYLRRIYDHFRQNQYDTLTDARADIRDGAFLGPNDVAPPALGSLTAAIGMAVRKAAVTTTRLATLAANIYGELVIAGYDWTTGNINVQVPSSAIGLHYDVQQDEYVNVAVATSPFSLYYALDTYSFYSIQIEMSSGVADDDWRIDVFGTNQTTPAAPNAKSYSNINSDIFGPMYSGGVSNALGAISLMFFADTAACPHYLRLTATCTAGVANDAEIALRVKRFY